LRILVYGVNYSPELTGVGKYTGEMVEWLSDHGCSVKVVTAPPYYPDWKVKEGYTSFRYQLKREGKVDVLRCPLYIPSNPTVLKRILHLMSFSVSSFAGLISLIRWKPDVVIVIEPSLFCTPGALLYSALTRAHTILHVQDFELDAMLGLGMVRSGCLTKIALLFERGLMRRFNRVSTISLNMLEKLKLKGVEQKRSMFFPNWVDTDFVTPEVNGENFRARWGFLPEHKIILYSGNIGVKQGLEVIVEAANQFRCAKDVHFLIVGQGAYRRELEKQAEEACLNNIHFFDLVPYELLPELMAMADIHLVVQRKGAADSVLPSKLTSILSAGGYSLITAEEETELGLLVGKYPGIAELVEPENTEEFIAGLSRLLARNQHSYNKVAREYATHNLRRDSILARFYSEIKVMCGKQSPAISTYEGTNND